MFSELSPKDLEKVRRLLIGVGERLPQAEEATLLYLRGQLGEGPDAITRYNRIVRGDEALPSDPPSLSPELGENVF